MAMGIPTIQSSSQLVGGPKFVSGEVSIISGDTSGTIDLEAYFAKVIKACINVMIFTTSAVVAVATIDYTTTARKLALTFADPGGNATVYFSVVGY